MRRAFGSHRDLSVVKTAIQVLSHGPVVGIQQPAGDLGHAIRHRHHSAPDLLARRVCLDRAVGEVAAIYHGGLQHPVPARRQSGDEVRSGRRGRWCGRRVRWMCTWSPCRASALPETPGIGAVRCHRVVGFSAGSTAVVLPPVATVICVAAGDLIGATSAALVFMLGVVGVALIGGLSAAVVAAIGATVMLNYFYAAAAQLRGPGARTPARAGAAAARRGVGGAGRAQRGVAGTARRCGPAPKPPCSPTSRSP